MRAVALILTGAQATVRSMSTGPNLQPGQTTAVISIPLKESVVAEVMSAVVNFSIDKHTTTHPAPSGTDPTG